MNLKIIAVSAFMATIGASAHASTVTRTFDITASEFYLIFGSGSPAPIDPVYFDFTVSLDPTDVIGPTTTGLTVNYFNLPDAVEFTYAPGDDLTLVAYAGFDTCGVNANSFCLFIGNPFSASPTYIFDQGTSSGDVWDPQNITATVSAIPETATWTLMLIGFSGLGAASRSHRAQQSPNEMCNSQAKKLST